MVSSRTLIALGEPLSLPKRRLKDYNTLVGEKELEKVKALAEGLRGLKLLHINSTHFGGGVAENLRALVPLLRDLGIDASWRVLKAPLDFFQATKALHNALQGKVGALTTRLMELYLRYTRELTEQLASMLEDYDAVVIHDPHPLPLVRAKSKGQVWLWRCHLDAANGDYKAWEGLLPFLKEYDAAIFTLPHFYLGGLEGMIRSFYPPCIDPLSDKNRPLAPEEAERVLNKLGIDGSKPLLIQVARFDPWKDPIGLIQAFRRVREREPSARLLLVGSMAHDDPEAAEWLNKSLEAASSVPGVRVLTNLSDVEVNALQRASNVVLQNSVREGFGLSVTEALWKGRPVVSRPVGGIVLQVLHGINGYLCSTYHEVANKALELLRNPTKADEMGARGREHVLRNFLIIHQLKEELGLMIQLGIAGRR